MTAADGQDLEGFRRALLAQHQERCLNLKRAADEDLADIITARRLEVEGIVHRLHRSAENRLREGLASNLRQAEQRLKIRRTLMQNGFLEHLEKSVSERVAAFRATREYRGAMLALLAEAQKRLPRPSVVLVEKGDAVHLEGQAGGLEIREEIEDVWGGLVLIGAAAQTGPGNPEGTRLVDNTFRTRWRRLVPVLVEELRVHMNAFPDPVLLSENS